MIDDETMKCLSRVNWLLAGEAVVLSFLADYCGIRCGRRPELAT